MDDPLTDIFGPVEENSYDSVEEKEEPEEQQEKDEVSNIYEEKGEMEDDKPDYDPWRPLRQQVGSDLKELYVNKVPAVPGEGKIPHLCRECRFQCLISFMERKATKDLLRASKLDSP